MIDFTLSDNPMKKTRQILTYVRLFFLFLILVTCGWLGLFFVIVLVGTDFVGNLLYPQGMQEEFQWYVDLAKKIKV
jgi:hypothetical protein